jgi:hypothetical protein
MKKSWGVYILRKSQWFERKNKYYSSGNPVKSIGLWIPAFAGMTKNETLTLPGTALRTVIEKTNILI